MTHNPVHVLLVEDNPGDVLLTRRALDASAWDTDLSVVGTGTAALAHLRDPQTRRPDLVVLDVNLPGISGHGVLDAIRGDRDLTAMPVVMFSGSTDRDDIAASYRGHANCHVAKPADLDAFGHAVKAIEEFWVSIVELPTS